MAQNKRSFWLIVILLVIVLGLLVFVLNANHWMATRGSTDVCGYSIVPWSTATQQAMQKTMYSADILRQAYDQQHINHDQYYLYSAYLIQKDQQYPSIMVGMDGWNPSDRSFENDTRRQLREEFCNLNPCIQKQLNDVVFQQRYQCIDGNRLTVTPLLTPITTP